MSRSKTWNVWRLPLNSHSMSCSKACDAFLSSLLFEEGDGFLAMTDWKHPFRELRAGLLGLHRSNVQLYHSAILFPHYEACDPNQCQELARHSTASLAGGHLWHQIDAAGSHIALHVHYLYGVRKATAADYPPIERLFSGLDGWIKEIPDGLVPEFHIPRYQSQSDRDVARWIAFVYFLANSFQYPYFQTSSSCSSLGVEYDAFEKWPQPRKFHPVPILCHQEDVYEGIESWKYEFWEDESEEYYLPDVIESYLLGENEPSEFILASIMAIDLLTHALQPFMEETREKKTASPKQAKQSKPRSDRISQEISQLEAVIAHHHMALKQRDEEFMPMTSDEIAEKMGWYTDEGQPNQVKVSRRMERIFGPSPMSKYRALAGGGNYQPGFETYNDDDQRDIEGMVWDEDIDDRIDNS